LIEYAIVSQRGRERIIVGLDWFQADIHPTIDEFDELSIDEF
jgi:hypothetical protein